jgi:hypothetical protein
VENALFLGEHLACQGPWFVFSRLGGERGDGDVVFAARRFGTTEKLTTADTRENTNGTKASRSELN